MYLFYINCFPLTLIQASDIRFIDVENPVIVGYTACNGNVDNLNLNFTSLPPEKVTDVVFLPNSGILMVSWYSLITKLSDL